MFGKLFLECMHFTQAEGTLHAWKNVKIGSEMGIGFWELMILAGIPLLLLVVGVVIFLAVRGPKK